MSPGVTEPYSEARGNRAIVHEARGNRAVVRPGVTES